MKAKDIIELNGKTWEVVGTGSVELPSMRSDWLKQGYDVETYYNLRYVGIQLATQPYEITAIARKHNKSGKISIAPR